MNKHGTEGEDVPSMDEFEYTLTRRALRQIKAEAWDEGNLSGGYWGTTFVPEVDQDPPSDNPYREGGPR